ncbi:TPA: hypothetical protein ACIJNH_000828 [Klebsiella pneumoniae]
MDFLRYIQMRFLSYHCDNFLRIYYHSVLKQLLEQAKLANEKSHRIRADIHANHALCCVFMIAHDNKKARQVRALKDSCWWVNLADSLFAFLDMKDNKTHKYIVLYVNLKFDNYFVYTHVYMILEGAPLFHANLSIVAILPLPFLLYDTSIPQ